MSILENLRTKTKNDSLYKKCETIKEKINSLQLFFLSILFVFSIAILKLSEQKIISDFQTKFILFVFFLLLGSLYYLKQQKIFKKENLSKKGINDVLHFSNIKLTDEGLNIVKKELNPENNIVINNIINDCKVNNLNDIIILQENIKRYKIIEEAFKDLSEDNSEQKRVPYNYRFVHYFNLKKTDLNILKYNPLYKNKIECFIKNKENINIITLYNYLFQKS